MLKLRSRTGTHLATATLLTLAAAAALRVAPTRAAGNDAAPTKGAPSRSVDFNRDVRPILAEACFPCHGFDESSRKAKLRLDVPEGAYRERNGVIAIQPGSPAGSEVWRRITSDDEDEVMPPPKAPHRLTDAQKATIKAWIEQGAPYANHWSLIAPKKPPLPDVSRSAWVANEIDRFVLARLDAEGLKPSPEADRRTYIRRVSLDLIGLPPGAEEVEAFVQDQSPDAYQNLVDRLLASPHFGERLAQEWLDAARYADTNGFSIDGGRHMWLWRDWVINAFNTNLPYDRFLVEQIAGDLLPDATAAQRIATGFQRNNMVTHEGGTIPEENLVNYNVDRVKTFGEAVLGLTLACAQCHDHKYDPITQRDYYRMFAFFNTVSDVGLDGNAGVNPRPILSARTVLRTGEEPSVSEDLQKLRTQLANPDPKQFAAWEQRQRDLLAQRGRGLELQPVNTLKVSTPNRGQGFEVKDGHVLIDATDLAAYDVSVELPKTDKPITGFRVVFYPSEKLGGGWGHGPADRRPARRPTPPKPAGGEAAKTPEAQPNEPPFKGNFLLTAFTASADAVPGDQVNLNRILDVQRVTASSWQDAFPAGNCLDPRNHNGWAPDPKTEGPVHLTVTLSEPVSASRTPYATVQLNFGNGRSQVAADFEIFAMHGTDDGTDLPADVVALLSKDASERSADESARMAGYFAAHAEETRATRIAIANLEERLAVQTREFPTMVMDVAPKPRETFVLHRGDYAQRREKVTAGTPGALPPLPEGAPNDRLGLATWATMRNNPLTTRVAVNRFWQMLFGAGLVRTSADFGTQGEWPTHPELLDWLAVDFMDNGWDTKAMIRKIVLSSTYRQSSAPAPELLERDPQNRLLARGPRFRLSAEQIRDSALKVSGLLVPRLGGPSVNPYTPGDLWREISHYGSTPATAQTFVQDHGEKLYRRSLYTYWKRTAPPPNMAVFDAPNREVCVVARPQTNTPLQALVLLNDVQYVEAARAFAERILKHGGDDAGRLRWAFAECLSRPPESKELQVLTSALARERSRYTADPGAARALLANGESPRDESIRAEEHAAWTQIASLLLNLSETVTRN